MSSISGISNKLKKIERDLHLKNKVRPRSTVYMDLDGEIMWIDGVEYNKTGVLVIPLPMTISEWEAANL